MNTKTTLQFINKTRINYNMKHASETDGLPSHWQALTVAHLIRFMLR